MKLANILQYLTIYTSILIFIVFAKDTSNIKGDDPLCTIPAEQSHHGRQLSQWHIDQGQVHREGLGNAAHLRNITILHFNDWHGMYEQTDIDFTLCTTVKRSAGECAGGASRMKSRAQKLAVLEKSDVIIIAAGDMMMGSIYDSYYMGAASAVIMNTLPVTLMGLGESDFMLGKDSLLSFINAVTFPVLKPANVQVDRNSKFYPLLKEYHIIERPDGFRIGFVSYILPETPYFTKVPKGFTFYPVQPAIHDLTSVLRSRNLVDMILAIGHAGEETDTQVAKQTKDIDMIISGHEHVFPSVFSACIKQLQGKKRSILSGKALCAFNDRNKMLVDRPEGALPAREMNIGRVGDVIPIYRTMWGGRYFGKLIITYDKEYKQWLGYGAVNEMLGSPSSDSVVELDRKMERLMDKLRQPLIQFSITMIGTIKALELPIGKLIKYNETLAGNFVCDALLWYVRTQMPKAFENKYGPVNVCILDTLSFNAPFPRPKEGVSYLDIINFYPMPDFLSVVQISGQQLFEILNTAVNSPENFVQVGGLQFAYLYKRPEGLKVMNALMQDSDGDFIEIDPCQNITIVMNNYLAEQLKSYLQSGQTDVILRHGAGIQHAMYIYLALNEIINVKLENRIIPCEINGTDHDLCKKPGSHDYMGVPKCKQSEYTPMTWQEHVIETWEKFPITEPINTKRCVCQEDGEYINYFDSAVDRAIFKHEKKMYNKYVMEMKL